MPMMAAALFAASSACGDKCKAASANAVSSTWGLRDAMAATATVPHSCCSLSSCCCSSVERFSFKSLAYAGTVSRSSLRFIESLIPGESCLEETCLGKSARVVVELRPPGLAEPSRHTEPAADFLNHQC